MPPSGFTPPSEAGPLVSLAPTDVAVEYLPPPPPERVFPVPSGPFVETAPPNALPPLTGPVVDLTPSSPVDGGELAPVVASASASWLSSPWVWLAAGVVVFWWFNDRRR